MREPVLVVLAAGMGSRYGGLKQMDPVDSEGHTLLDFSVYDAMRSGFRRVVFIIKHSIEEDFVRLIGDRIASSLEVTYVFQENDRLPAGYEMPKGRVKPFGTGHALLCCKDVVREPFAVINADDYYGPKAFQMLHAYLATQEDDEMYRYVMVGYHIENTVTEHGHVARGLCTVNENKELCGITERTRIEKKGEGAAYSPDDGKTWVAIPDHTPVSMNCWGFTPGFLVELNKRFPAFLDAQLAKNPLNCEYFLPSVVDELLKEEKASVKVLESEEKWYGVTYKADKAAVKEAIRLKKTEGLYPDHLWR